MPRDDWQKARLKYLARKAKNTRVPVPASCQATPSDRSRKLRRTKPKPNLHQCLCGSVRIRTGYSTGDHGQAIITRSCIECGEPLAPG